MVKFSLKQRIERLEQIVIFSKLILQEFGLFYLIKAAFYEIKTEKFAIFNNPFYPKFEQVFQNFHQINYQEWLQKKLYFQKQENLLINQQIVHFYLQIPLKYNKIALEKTINSLKSQDHESWKLYLFTQNNEKLSNYSTDEKITQIFTGDNVEKLNHHISINPCDYLGFVNIGEQFQFNAITQFLSISEPEKYDLIYSDSDEIDSNETRINPFFKPDWLPYMILSLNYIGFFLIKHSKLLSIGGIRRNISDNGLYDLLLNSDKKTKIFHIPFPLISLPFNPISFYHYESNAEIVKQTLSRRGISVNTQSGIIKNTVRINFPLTKKPKVSIIIPTKDSPKLLKRCLKSLQTKTNYKNFEILIVDNGCIKDNARDYLNSFSYKIISYNENYNFSKINNLAAKHATGELLLFMNDDVAALKDNWLTELVCLCLLPDVAIVGPKLVYRNNTIQSAGSFFLKTGAGWHPYSKKSTGYCGNFGLANVMRDYSGITASCMIMKKNVFDQIGGFDESFDLYYGDSDLCFQSKSLGYSILYTPYATLLHDGAVTTTRSAKSFFTVENHYRFVKKHAWIKKGDPTYTPNLDWNHILSGKSF